MNELADSQIQAGADVLDINVGVPGIDGPEVMRAVVMLTSAIRAIDLILGRDEYSMRYITHYRQPKKS